MRVRVDPGSAVGGRTRVPGDKSIAHRWLILAATARGRSRLLEVPASLDVHSTAACLAALAPEPGRGLDVWRRNAVGRVEGGGSTWNVRSTEGLGASSASVLEVEGDGRDGLVAPTVPLDCGNSGTSMRLLAGVAAAAPFRTVLEGDASLSRRPMERVAVPLRRLGARVDTTDGHPPILIEGSALRGIRYESPVASAQVKGAVLLAGTAADGETTLVERARTRDHTERAFRALGGDVRVDGHAITVSRFQHEGFEGRVPGDVSSAAFLVAAAAITGGSLTVADVGLNPSRTAYLDMMRRAGVPIDVRVDREEVGEPVGEIVVGPAPALSGIQVERDELPGVVDEVPVLAALAAHASGPSWFVGAGELRVKESDRLTGLAEGLRALGQHAAVEGDDLVVGGGGVEGGRVASRGDHRMAMAFAVTALAAEGSVEVDGMEAEAVSFPGFARTLRELGATVTEVER